MGDNLGRPGAVGKGRKEGGRKSPRWRVIRIPEMCLGAFEVPLFEENANFEEINPLPSTFSRTTRFLFLFDIDKDFSYDCIKK